MTVLAEAKSTSELLDKINEFVKVADEICQEYHKQAEHHSSLYPTHFVEINRQWTKVWTKGLNQTLIYAFICMKDGHTKDLGQFKMGDIHRAATWRSPAKHKRGNLFDPKGYKQCMTPHGIVYLGQTNTYHNETK